LRTIWTWTNLNNENGSRSGIKVGTESHQVNKEKQYGSKPCDSKAIFEAAIFEGAIFEAAIFKAAIFERAIFKAAVFKAAIFEGAIFKAAVFKAINTKATQAAFAEKFSRSTDALNEIIQESNDPDITHATSAIVGSTHATSAIVGSELIPEVNEKH
jgi:uncharacterized protein YjbI with pentapeptide repeats